MGASLPNRPAYRTNPEETKEIESQVQDLLEKGWVQKSLSPCAVPVLLVPKKDGKWRMCCDCRAMNCMGQLYSPKLTLKVDITKFESRRVMSGKPLLRPNLDYMSGW